MSWLVRRVPSAVDEVLAAAEVAATRAERRRGLLGRDQVEGALVLRPCRQVHTFRMRMPIDVVWCADDGRVLRIATMAPGRVSRPVLRARFVIEAAAGATDRWRLRVGDSLEVIVADGRDEGPK
ncbi:MAG: DUF192 domain-containing protein [Acidimicrobiia bacterium]|jgi:hypothetical protein|nr:DUF192 domain-containing protein [Acidimicrobiia bacterium]